MTTVTPSEQSDVPAARGECASLLSACTAKRQPITWPSCTVALGPWFENDHVLPFHDQYDQ
jgi:hypothetical protein